MRSGYHRVTEAACAHCTAPFERRVSEVKRGGSVYCSRACKYSASRGRSYTSCICSSCGDEFQRFTYLVLRAKRLFCGARCANSALDPAACAAAGRVGGLAPHRQPPPEVRAARSRAGGLARGRNQPRERLVEIAMAGVRARLAKPLAHRREIARKATFTRLAPRKWYGAVVPFKAKP